LREIEADPLDIDDLKTELSKIDQQFSAVSKRFSDWERLQNIYSTIMVKMRISFVQQRFESKSSPEQQIKKYPRHVLHRFYQLFSIKTSSASLLGCYGKMLEN